MCRRLLLMLLLIGAAVPAQAATVYYVDAAIGSSGVGTSWATAKKTLGEALALAASGDSVWIRAGTYYPSSIGDRNASFIIPAGVAVYGGFAGTETLLSQRNWRGYQTILSGDIGTIGTATDNSINVVKISVSGFTLDGVTVRDAYNGSGTGGGLLLSSASGTIANCAILGNFANHGGGMYSSNGNLTITACIFRGNSVNGIGGGAYLYQGSGAVFTNCVFSGNGSDLGGSFTSYGGGAVFNESLSANTTSYRNCTFQGNTASGSAGGAVVSYSGGNPSYYNCIFVGNTASVAGSGQMLNYSSGTATATNCIIEGGTPTGTTGSGILTSNPSFINAANPLGPDGRWATMDDGLTLAAGSAAINAGTSSPTPPTTDVRGVTRSGGPDIGAYEANALMYVSPSGTGGGTSWTDAFTTVAAALAAARGGDEIWVQTGTYVPTTGSDRTIAFAVPPSVSLFGGFVGNETSRNQRNWNANPTILSGEINSAAASDNSRHVLDLGSSAVVDGFTVRDGYTDNSSGWSTPHNWGGGILCNGTSPTIRNCAIVNNTAYWGGGLAIYNGANPLLENCIIAKNTATGAGGGFAFHTSALGTLRNCTVALNSSVSLGSGIHIFSSATGPTLLNTIVYGNSGGTASMTLASSNAAISYSLIQGSGGSGAWNSSFGTNNGNNRDADPDFRDPSDPDGGDNAWMTADDGLVLRGSSPAVNAGTASGAPALDILAKTRPIGSAYDMGPYECRGTIYVNPAGSNTGTSWATGYTTLGAALAVAANGDEIWVKAGTYTPGAARANTFTIPQGVSVYGGFNGSETSRAARDWRANLTILSGAIGGGGNTYHIVTPGGTTVIDGFIVSDGDARGAPTSWGGGFFCYLGGPTSSPTIRNCVIANCFADWGGALAAYTSAANPTLENCVVTGNSATNGGGGLFIYSTANATVRNSTFSANTQSAPYGAITVYSSSTASIINTVAWGNAIASVYRVSSTAAISFSLLQGSFTSGSWNGSAGTDGGGNLDADPLFLNGSSGPGSDGIWLTADDGLRLLGGSPAANSGTAAGAPATDILNQARTLGGGIDLGAYEGRCPSVQFTSPSSSVSESAGTANLGLSLTGAADYPITVPYSAGAGGTATDGALIGNGTIDWSFPLYTYYHDARTQSIYLASEMGGAGTLRSLTLDVSGIPSMTMTAFTIRLQHTGLSAFTGPANWLNSGWTTVYSGNLTVTSTGLLTLPFSTPFSYNGSSNLIVDISFNNSAWLYPWGTVKATDTGANRSLFFNTDSGFGDPLTWGAAFANGSLITYVPNVRLGRSAVVADGGTAAGPRADANALGSVTIPPGNATWTIPVPIFDDTINEGNETLVISLGTPSSSGGGAARLATTTSHTLTISDDDPTPNVQFASNASAVGESWGAQSIAVNLSGKSDKVVTATWVNLGGTATAGTDYTGLGGGTITFQPGETTAALAWTPQPDLVDENDETIQIGLTGATNATLGATTQHTATIVDDDDAGVAFTTTSVVLSETSGSDTATIGVHLTSQPLAGSTITLNFASSSTAQATVSPPSLAFTSASGSWDADQTITITAVNDAFADGTATPTITATVTVSGTADPKFAAVVPSPISTSISDDDTPGLAIGFPLLATTASSVSGTSVQLPAGTLQNLVDSLARGDTVVLAFVGAVANSGGLPNSGEYQVSAVNNGSGVVTLTSAPNATAAAQAVLAMSKVSGPVLESALAGTAASVSGTTVHLSGSPDLSLVTPGMLLTFSGSSPNQGSFIIKSVNDATDDIVLVVPVVTGLPSLSNTAVAQGVGIGGQALTYVRALSQPTAQVTIGFSSSDTTEGVPGVASITIPSDGTWATLRPVTIFPVNDAVDDGNQGWTLKVLATTSTDPAYNGLDPSDLQLVTVDDDTKAVVFTPSSPSLSVAEGSSTSYKIHLASEPTATVTISLGFNSAQLSLSASSLTFTPTDWASDKTVIVTAIQDSLIEGNIAYSITHTVLAGSDYTGLSVGNATITILDDDVPGFVVNGVVAPSVPASVSIAEGSFVNVGYRLTSDPGVAVTVTFGLTGAGGIAPGSLTWNNGEWNTVKYISVSAPEDVNTTPETYTLSGTCTSGPAAFQSATVASVTCNTVDNDISGFSITESGGTTAVSEATAGTPDSFQIRLNPTALPGAGANFIQVDLVASNSQITISPATLVWTAANWTAVKTVNVYAVNDTVAEGAQSSVVSIQTITTDDPSATGYNPSLNATLAAALPTTTVTVSVADDDSAGVVVTPTSGLTVTEAGGTASFFVRLTSQPAADGTVQIPLAMGGVFPGAASISTDGGASFSTTGAVTFTTSGGGAASDWNVPHEVIIRGENDDLAGGTRPFTVVTGSAADSGGGGYNGLAVADVAGSTIDNDSVGVILSSTTLAATEAGGTATYMVRLACQPTSASVTINIDGGSQVTVNPSTLTFTNATGAGGWDTNQSVLVTAIQDHVDEPSPHTGTITHTAIGGDYTGIAILPVTVSITDDPADVVGFVIGATTAKTLERPLSVTVDAVAGAVATCSGSPDLSLVQAGMVLSFTGSTPNTGTWLVTAVDNSAKTITLGASVPTSGASLTSSGTDQAASVGGSVPINLHLTSKPQGTVTISLLSSDSTAATVSPATLTFSPSNWNSDLSFSVTPVDDQRDTPSRTPTIVTTVTATDPAYNGAALADVAVTVVDDDTAGLVVALPGGGLQTTEAGGNASFTVALATAPAASVVIPLDVDDGAQGQVTPGSLTFTTANWSQPQVVTVTGRDDDGVDNGAGGTTYHVNIKALSGDATYAALPYTNGADAGDLPVLNLRSNATPACDQPGNVTANEDASPLTTVLTGIGSGQVGEVQTLTITATSNNPSLIPDPPISGSGTTRTLDITPNADANGTATITVTITDDNTVDGTPRTLQRSFTVTINPVDDAPLVAINGSSAAYTEDDPPVVLVPNLTLTDIDTANMVGATVLLTPIPDGPAETLSVTGSGITGSWDPATGMLTLTGTQPQATFQAALRTLTYSNASDDPDTSLRTVSIRVNDGTALSVATSTTFTVAKRNDAPQLSGAADLASILEDVPDPANTGTQVDALVAQLTVSDADASDATHRGIAVVAADTAHGSWQFTVNGGTSWTSLDLSAGALLLRGGASESLRFRPAQYYNGQANITVRAWDWTSGNDGDTGVSTALNGGSSAFSSETAVCTITVDPVNNAPVIAGTAQLNPIAEDTAPAANAGTAITSVLPVLTITDVDVGDPRGLALVGADTTNGSWEASVDGGATWNSIDTVAADNGLLMPDSALALVRFLPDPDFNGTASLTVAAWDLSAGVAGSLVDTTIGTSCSASTATLTVTVTPVNDAPVGLTATGLPLNAITENIPSPANTGTPVAALIDALSSDVDAGASQGLAVTGCTGAGIWEYRTSTSGSWTAIGAVADANALLLTDTGTVLLRYAPGLNEIGTFTVSYRIWDRTVGTNATYADASVNGGTTAFSTQVLTSSILVNSSATAPVVTLMGAALSIGEEAAATIIDADPSTNVDDFDSVTFDGGSMTVSISSPDAGDIIAIPGLSAGDAFLIGPTTIGTVDLVNDGTSGRPLVISFASGAVATHAAVTTMLKSLTFRTSSDTPPAGVRTISITVNDGGLTSTPATKPLTILPFNDPPVPITPAHWLTLVPGVTLSSQIQAYDPEGQPLTFAIDHNFLPLGTVTGMPRDNDPPPVATNTTGDFTYTAPSQQVPTTDSFVVLISDGVNTYSFTYTVNITLPAPNGIVITSMPPMQVYQTDSLPSYQPSVANASNSLRYYLINPPPGTTCGLTTGIITWPATFPTPTDPSNYFNFGLLVIDDANDTAGYQPILLHWIAGSNPG